MRYVIPVFFSIILIFSSRLSAQITLVLQPHFSHGVDNSIGRTDSLSGPCIGNMFQYESDSIHPMNPEFYAIAWTNYSCPIYFRHLLRFNQLSDTTLIPHSATILSAHLILYGVPSSPGNYGNSDYPGSPYPNTNETWLYELADTFNTYSVTWNSQPSILHADSVGIPPSTSHWSENDTMDVTAMVADMAAHVNTGFMFELQNETAYRERMFAGSYNSDSTLHPKLIIVIQCPNSITVQPKHDTVIEGTTAMYTVGVMSSVPHTYQWQENPGSGFVSLANVWPYSGVTTDTLLIHNTSMFLDTTHYRCIVDGGTQCADTTSSAILVVNRNTAGISNLALQAVEISPNPAHDELSIRLPGTSFDGDFQLFNQLGQVEYSGSILGNETRIRLENLVPGMYILKIQLGGRVVYKKIVKN